MRQGALWQPFLESPTFLILLTAFATYLYGLKYIAVALALAMLISGLDDLLIDVVYWIRRLKRYFRYYRRNGYMAYDELYKVEEKPLAIMVPAWQEHGVIGNMALLAATTLDYENYQIFVGTYPNDPSTQEDVDEVCARFPNVHKVVCARPGPTSKADCLNNILDAILQFEQSANFHFAGFILHDAEDVLSAMELRLFNYLVGRKDLIQIPVYPFERKWTNFTSMTYIDEFAELHGKDVPLREALAGQVPSAGVGTCFSRRGVMALLEDGDGIAFDVQSLTEDYDIGLRLAAKGMEGIFVRFSVLDEQARARPKRMLQGYRAANVICVREYFPDTLWAAVRQKTRWIIGIIYQGYKTHRWTKSPLLNYFLWRDRKGLLSNFLSFLAMLVFIQLVLLWLYEVFWPDPWQFLSIFSEDKWLVWLLAINFVLMLNRIFQRVFFVTSFYGLRQGLLSILRLFWANLINFLANWRALIQVLSHGDPRRVAWDKTSHDFPSVSVLNRALRPLGQILVEQGVITPEQLTQALENRTVGLRLGGSMLHQGLISAEQLAAALAAQNNVSWRSIGFADCSPEALARVPAAMALRYAVLPLVIEGSLLTVAREEGFDPVSLAALERRTGLSIQYIIVPRGQVVVGLRHYYQRDEQESITPSALLERAVTCGLVAKTQAPQLWDKYVSRQLFFAEILVSLGHISPAAKGVLLLRHEHSTLKFGEFLVQEGTITQALLDRALELQQQLQPSMEMVLQQHGVSAVQVEALKQEQGQIHV